MSLLKDKKVCEIDLARIRKFCNAWNKKIGFLVKNISNMYILLFYALLSLSFALNVIFLLCVCVIIMYNQLPWLSLSKY